MLKQTYVLHIKRDNMKQGRDCYAKKTCNKYATINSHVADLLLCAEFHRGISVKEADSTITESGKSV